MSLDVIPRLIIVVRAIALAVPVLLAGAADAQTTVPQPRALGDSHYGAVKQIAYARATGVVASIGEDKTLRVWRGHDLRLMRVVALPSDLSREGVPYALAVSPDGRSAFVGGYTGVTWHRAATVYRVDLQSGRLEPFLRGVPGEIHAMAVSHDGARLAIGAADRLKVIDIATKAKVLEDTEYAERVDSLEFAIHGALAVAATDGCLRIYVGAALGLAFRSQYPPAPPASTQCLGSELGDVKFSPDGALLAFGVRDRPEVVVMDAVKLVPLRVLKAPANVQLGLCCLSWSADSEALVAYGRSRDDREATPLYRSEGRASSSLELVTAYPDRLTQTTTGAGGDLFLATARGTIWRSNSAGAAVASTSQIARDYASLHGRIQLSSDGHVVTVPASAQTPGFVFSVDARPDQALRLDAAAPHSKASTSLEAGPVRVDVHGLGPLYTRENVSIGGRPIPLEKFELLQSWASHPTFPFAALGTNWFLRLVGENGLLLWSQYVPSEVQSIALSANGKWVVAALGDGTIRWYQTETGEARVNIFVHRHTSEWVAWRDDGYFMSSPRGDSLFGWVVNRSDEHAADVIKAVQFERTLYRPDKVHSALRASNTDATASSELTRTLKELSAPRVSIESIRSVAEGLEINFHAESTGQPLEEFGIYLDGLPVVPSHSRILRNTQRASLTHRIVVPSVATDPVIRVEVETKRSLGIAETVLVRPIATTPQKAGRLWIVSVGVHRFDALPGVSPLPFATNDARQLAKTLALATQSSFREIVSIELTEDSGVLPTKRNIMEKLRTLEGAGPEDTVVVFLASHGITDASEYYFIAKDSIRQDVDAVLAKTGAGTVLAPGSAKTLISGSELSGALRRVAGKRILILDTCHGGAAAGTSNPYALIKRSASTLVGVVSAARGDELSYESPVEPHGAFTASMIAALRQQSIGRQVITLQSLFDTAVTKLSATVAMIRTSQRSIEERNSIRQTPILMAPPPIATAVLVMGR